MSGKNVREAYAALGQGLPSYEEVNECFCIDEIDAEKLSIKAVCRRAGEHVEHYAQLLETVLQPDATFTGMTEAGAFDEGGKKDVLETLRKLMRLHRTLLLSELENGHSAETLAAACKEYAAVKAPLASIIKKLQECWHHEQEENIEEKYFG
jgi:hypothetical protein